MVAKKKGGNKGQKMSLVDFLGEGPSTTSWADDEIYLPSAPMASAGTSAADSSSYARRDYGGSSGIQSGRAAVDFPTSPPYTSFVGNLSFNADEATLRDFFAGLPVDSVRLIRDRENDKPKGYGYVQFADLESLKVAVGMDGRDLGGRPVRINVSEQRQDNARESAPTGPWRRPAGEDTATSPFASRSSSGFGRPQRDFAAASSAADSGDWRSNRPEPSATTYAAAPPLQVRERREFREPREPREPAEASAADAGDWRVNRPEPSATAYAAAPPPQVRERREFREPREPSAADAGDWRVNRPEPADIRTVFGNDRSPSATRTGRVRRDSPAGAAADAAADDGADAAAVQGEEAGAWRKDKPTMPRDYQPARERSESREPRVQRKPREPREPVAESSWRVARSPEPTKPEAAAPAAAAPAAADAVAEEKTPEAVKAAEPKAEEEEGWSQVEKPSAPVRRTNRAANDSPRTREPRSNAGSGDAARPPRTTTDRRNNNAGGSFFKREGGDDAAASAPASSWRR